MANILVVDDEKLVLALIRNIFQKDNHVVTAVSDPEKVFDLPLGSFQMILLDVMMPGIDGFTLCHQIRAKVDCPILFLTAKGMENDIAAGLSKGADDYILKPFGAVELRARIEAHLRRENRQRRNVLCLGDIEFELSGKKVTVREEQVSLTKSQYEICEFLAYNRGQVFSKEKIYETVMGFDADGDSSAVVEHIKNIRGKFALKQVFPIETVWGIGYKWS